MEPRMRQDLEEFLRICDGLIQYLTDEECEEMACIVYFVRQKTVRPYDDLDNLAASLAFSTLSATLD
jgi:hypothetical protein